MSDRSVREYNTVIHQSSQSMSWSLTRHRHLTDTQPTTQSRQSNQPLTESVSQSDPFTQSPSDWLTMTMAVTLTVTHYGVCLWLWVWLLVLLLVLEVSTLSLSESYTYSYNHSRSHCHWLTGQWVTQIRERNCEWLTQSVSHSLTESKSNEWLWLWVWVTLTDRVRLSSEVSDRRLRLAQAQLVNRLRRIDRNVFTLTTCG